MARASLDQLEAFVHAAEGGSFSEAARRLGKAQSTVSALIEALEIDSGCSLFDRSSRSPTLTTQGTALLAEARSVLQASSFFSQRCEAIINDEEKQVTIVIDPSAIDMNRLKPVLGGFHSRFPHTRLVVIDSSLKEPFELVSNGDAHIGVCFAQNDNDYPDTLHFRGIASSGFITAAAPVHPLAHSELIHPHQLAQHTRLRITSRAEGARLDEPELGHSVWYFSSYLSLIDVLKDGTGWADVALHQVVDLIDAGTLVRLDTEHQRVPYTHPVDLVWSKNQDHGEAVTWLIHEITNACA